MNPSGYPKCPQPGPQYAPDCLTARIKQTAIFPYDDALKADVDSGRVQFTLSGCLGGFADQSDHVHLGAMGFDEVGKPTSGEIGLVQGPTASQRGNQTILMPRGTTEVIPAGTRSLLVRVYFNGGAGNYNDGYADNIALRLSPTGSTPPAADCPPVSHASSPTSPYGTNSAVGLIRVGKLNVKGRSARLKLVCVRPGTRCKGKLKLVAKLGGKSVQLGTAKFNITDRKSKRVKVKLKKSVADRLATLSKKKLKKLLVSVTATIGADRTKYKVAVARR